MLFTSVSTTTHQSKEEEDGSYEADCQEVHRRKGTKEANANQGK